MIFFQAYLIKSWDEITVQAPSNVSRAVASGGAGGRALAPPIFGQTVTPISSRGADYNHHSTMSPPEFRTLRRAWCLMH